MAAADTLDLYSDKTKDFSVLLESIIHFGVFSDSPSTKKAILAYVAFLFAEKNKDSDFQVLVTAVVRLFCPTTTALIYIRPFFTTWTRFRR